MADGLVMPAEWEPHAATWIGWPPRAGDESLHAGGNRPRAPRLSALSHESRLDPRLRPNLRAQGRLTGHRAISLQRLGQVQGLEEGRPDPRARREAVQAAIDRRANRSRRRQHRREWPRHADHDGRMPARSKGAGAQSRTVAL